VLNVAAEPVCVRLCFPATRAVPSKPRACI
jgi:hypothetical protein